MQIFRKKKQSEPIFFIWYRRELSLWARLWRLKVGLWVKAAWSQSPLGWHCPAGIVCVIFFELFTMIWTNQAHTCSSLLGNEFTVFIGYIKPCTVRASRLMSGRPLAGGNTSSLRKRLEAGLPPPRTKATLSRGHRLLCGDLGKETLPCVPKEMENETVVWSSDALKVWPPYHTATLPNYIWSWCLGSIFII